MSVRAAAAKIIAADFSAVHTDSPLQRAVRCSGCRQQLSGFRRRCCAVNGYKWRHNSVIDNDVINFIVLCRSTISTNAISSTAVPNKTAASLFRVLLCSPIMTINQPITFVYSCWQRTVRHYRCVTRTALSVNNSRFWPAAARTDIPSVLGKWNNFICRVRLQFVRCYNAGRSI